MTDTIMKNQDEIINEFSNFNDWFEKYEYLISLGKALEAVDESIKIDHHAIGGCQSQVWMKAEQKNGTIHYQIDSDSLIVKGMISLLLRVLNDQQPDVILNTDLYFIEKIGLRSHLSPTRTNGLLSIINHIKAYAKDLK
jgi:cysteine desulfuration protein SufE